MLSDIHQLVHSVREYTIVGMVINDIFEENNRSDLSY